MKKLATVFASKPERKAFTAIEERLPKGWKLYPNLPLSQLVSIDEDEVTTKEWDFYLKSNVDFTVARGEEPSLIIEFDGLAGGFSSGADYRPGPTSRDKMRRTKLDFKLNICRSVGLPLVVISFDELETLPGQDFLRVVHSIVAHHIASCDLAKKVKHWDDNARGAFNCGRRITRLLGRVPTFVSRSGGRARL